MLNYYRLVMLCGVFGLATLASAHEDGVHTDWKKTGNSRAVKLQQCVEATQVMRRDHMKFLLHQRDETMHEGIRTKKHSLVNCISCHVNKDAQDKFIPANAKGQFCETCHTFAGVSMDCFQCHATKPRSSAQADPLTKTKGTAQAPRQSLRRGLGALVLDAKSNSALLGPGRR